MADIHIVCRRPPSPPVDPDRAYPIINGIQPSLVDCEVTIDGAPVTNIESITWTVGGYEPARAVVTFIGATVDVEGIAPDAPTSPDGDTLTCTCELAYSMMSRLPVGRVRNPECEIHGMAASSVAKMTAVLQASLDGKCAVCGKTNCDGCP